MIKKIHKGFTLIELMIVVVVIAVLSAIAIPSYKYYVTRGKRASARTAIQNMAQQQERYFTQNNGYNSVAAGSTISNGWVNYVGDSYTMRTHDLTVSVGSSTTSTAASYTIAAAPANGFSDSQCGTLTLYSTGVQTQSAGTSNDCWMH